MDVLSELAPSFTPYRYGFNNPVFWQDATGLFESYLDARYYQLSHGLFGSSSIEYDADSNSWSINTGKSMITQVGEWIQTTYELDGGGLGVEKTKAGGGGSNNDNARRDNKNSDPGYNPFGVVLTTKDGKDSPVTPSRGPRNANKIDVSIIQFLVDLFGPKTTVPYELSYDKKKNTPPSITSEQEKPLTKDEQKIIKIQITKYQQADMWNKKDYSVPRTKYDSMININDEPAVRQSIIDDSLKYIR